MDLTPDNLSGIVRDFIEGKIGPRGLRRAVWPAIMGEAFDGNPLATAVEQYLSQITSGTLTIFQARWQLGNILAPSLGPDDAIVVATDSAHWEYIIRAKVQEFAIADRPQRERSTAPA